jgi:hypothetical protein
VGYPGELRQPWSVAIRGIPQQQFYITFNDFPYTNYWGVAQVAAHDSPVTQYDFGGLSNVNMTKNFITGVNIDFNNFPYTTYLGDKHDSPVTQYDYGGLGNITMTKNLIEGVYYTNGPIKTCHQENAEDFTCGYM